MKVGTKKLSHLCVLVAIMCSVLADQVTGQTFTALHSFSALNSNTNADGFRPNGGVVLSGNILYGTALFGGASGGGTVFALNTDGSGFMTLRSLDVASSDGVGPQAGLALSGNMLYGTATGGGGFGNGTVFAMSTDGSSFATIYSFSGSDGAFPLCTPTSSTNTLYGTTDWGGSSWGSGPSGRGYGTVFMLSTDGSSFTSLYSFTGGTDGSNPYDGLVVSLTTVYGTTTGDYSQSNGTVFAVNIDGTDFRTLHGFTGDSDGANPRGGLILSGNNLYGTADGGGLGGGTVFALNTDGTSFAVLHSFAASSPSLTNLDGFGAGQGMGTSLVLSGDTLYGTTTSGGTGGGGTVFAVNINGNGFRTLYNFSFPRPNLAGSNSDGAAPNAGLILSGNTLYGTTSRGGRWGGGTVFSLSLELLIPAQLKITQSAANVVLTWPTNLTGFTLQSITNLASPIWTTNLTAPVVVDGLNTLTNPISGTQQFFRLSQ
jgi:uncharacterized repeat protein (TIGR03803 family)